MSQTRAFFTRETVQIAIFASRKLKIMQASAEHESEGVSSCNLWATEGWKRMPYFGGFVASEQPVVQPSILYTALS